MKTIKMIKLMMMMIILILSCVSSDDTLVGLFQLQHKNGFDFIDKDGNKINRHYGDILDIDEFDGYLTYTCEKAIIFIRITSIAYFSIISKHKKVRMIYENHSEF